MRWMIPLVLLVSCGAPQTPERRCVQYIMTFTQDGPVYGTLCLTPKE